MSLLPSPMASTALAGIPSMSHASCSPEAFVTPRGAMSSQADQPTKYVTPVIPSWFANSTKTSGEASGSRTMMRVAGVALSSSTGSTWISPASSPSGKCLLTRKPTPTSSTAIRACGWIRSTSSMTWEGSKVCLLTTRSGSLCASTDPFDTTSRPAGSPSSSCTPMAPVTPRPVARTTGTPAWHTRWTASLTESGRRPSRSTMVPSMSRATSCGENVMGYRLPDSRERGVNMAVSLCGGRDRSGGPGGETRLVPTRLLG